MARNVFTLVFSHHFFVIMNIMIMPTHGFFLCGLCCWSNNFFQAFHNLFCASTREGLAAYCKLLCKSMKTSIKNVLAPPHPTLIKKRLKTLRREIGGWIAYFSNLQPGCSLKTWILENMNSPCMLYMVTLTINIPPMLVYILYHTWILWDCHFAIQKSLCFTIFATSITIKSLFFDISLALTCQIARFRVHLEKTRSGVNKKVPRLFEKKAVICWFSEI